MNVFAFTRIKLTIWYVTAIMAVSIMFSLVIYTGISRNIEDVFYRAEMRLRNSPNLGQQVVKQIIEQKTNGEGLVPMDNGDILDQFFIEELRLSKQKVFNNLLHANILILLLSSIASYVLASKTLEPIEKTLLEQKRFIADASHELRSPLTSLKTTIEVSLRDKALNSQSKKILSDNLEDVDALDKLITSLLQLASQENKTIVKQLIDINEVISRVIKTMKPLADKKGVKFTYKSKHQQILASETSLIQLMTILIDNAIKYSNFGGKVTVQVLPQKRYIVIRVVDKGIGIHGKYLPHIFDRFYRVDTNRTVSTRPGFGLGLSVAKQIVENHHGTLLVESEICKGSVFTVKLPV